MADLNTNFAGAASRFDRQAMEFTEVFRRWDDAELSLIASGGRSPRQWRAAVETVGVGIEHIRDDAAIALFIALREAGDPTDGVAPWSFEKLCLASAAALRGVGRFFHGFQFEATDGYRWGSRSIVRFWTVLPIGWFDLSAVIAACYELLSIRAQVEEMRRAA